MTTHTLFEGGDYRPVGYQHTRVAGNSDPEVRYAAHLMTRYKVIPWNWDAGDPQWQQYMEMEGDIAENDIVKTHLLSKDTRVNAIVLHNKLAAGIMNDAGTSIQTPTKIRLALYEGSTEVKGVDVDLSVVGRTILELVADPATTTTTTGEDSGTTSNTTGGPTVVGTTDVTTLGAYLGANGTVRMTVTQGNFDNACLSVFADVTDFLDVRGCSCVVPPCDTEYPSPKCQPSA